MERATKALVCAKGNVQDALGAQLAMLVILRGCAGPLMIVNLAFIANIKTRGDPAMRLLDKFSDRQREPFTKQLHISRTVRMQAVGQNDQKRAGRRLQPK